MLEVVAESCCANVKLEATEARVPDSSSLSSNRGPCIFSFSTRGNDGRGKGQRWVRKTGRKGGGTTEGDSSIIGRRKKTSKLARKKTYLVRRRRNPCSISALCPYDILVELDVAV